MYKVMHWRRNDTMDISALLIYVLIQGITPGPSNFMALYTSATLGIRGARGYLFGTMSGFFVKMLLCGLLNIALASLVPGLVPILKWVGAAYLVYLAVSIFLSGKKEQPEKPMVAATFMGGILLQALNMKSWIMGLTLFSLYVVPYTTKMLDILFWSVITLAIMFSCTLIWAVFGNSIKNVYAKYRLPLSIGMSLLLLYSAVKAVL